MADSYDIIISAVDSASEVFQSIISSVTGMGDSISNVAADASSDFDDLSNNINDAIANMDEADFEKLQSTITDVEAKFSEATEEVERLEDELAEVELNGDDIQADIIADELAEARAEAEAFEEALEVLNTMELSALGESIEITADDFERLSSVDIDITRIISGLSDVGSEAEDVGENVENTVTAFEHLGSAGDVMGASSLLEFAQSLSQSMLDAANSAGTFADSVNRAELEATGAGIPLEDMKNTFNELSEATGRSGTQIRESFIKATARGITDTEAFTTMMKGAGAQAYLFGTDIQSMGDKFSGLAMKSTLMEKALAETGITMDELATAMGMTGATADEVKQKWSELDANQRATILGTAASMNEGKNANDEYKTSWQGLRDQVDMARGRIQRVAGSVILPVLIPAMKLAGDILQGVGDTIEYVMKSPLGGLVSILGTAAGLFIVLVTAVSAASTIIGFLGLEATFSSIELWALALAGDAEALSALGVEGGSLLASTGLGAMATAAWGAATAVWALISPMLPFIVAAALVAIAIYEVGKAFGWWSDVSSMFDAISDGLQKMWKAFINHPDVQAAISAISNALQTLWKYIQQAGQAIMDFFNINSNGNFDIVHAIIEGIGLAWDRLKDKIMLVVSIVQGIIWVFGEIGKAGTELWESLTEAWDGIMEIMEPYITIILDLVNGLITAFDQFKTGQLDLPGLVVTVLSLLWNAYLSVITLITNAVLSFAGRMLSYALQTGSNFVNGIVQWISQLPGRVASYMSSTLSRIVSIAQQWVSNAVSKASSLVSNVASTLSGLPGKIASALSGVVNAIVKPFQDAYNRVAEEVDKIKNKASEVTGIAFGGETAEAGELIGGSGEVSFTGSSIDVNVNEHITLDLENVPAHIDTNTLIRMLSDRDVLKALTGNKDFQELDSMIKGEILAKTRRANGGI